MNERLVNALINSEKELIKILRKNKYIISECDIQSLHYSILIDNLKNLNYGVSTEWSLTNEVQGAIDLVVFKKWGENDFSNWENRKACYQNIVPEYLVEYKNDFSKSLSIKKIDSLFKQVYRINELASNTSNSKFRGAAILFHEGPIFKNEVLIDKYFRGINWTSNLDFIFIYYNASLDLVKTWEQIDYNIKIDSF